MEEGKVHRAERTKIFYGWWIVFVSFILSFFAGGTFLYGFTTFFNPIRKEFGWSAAVTSIAFVLQRLEFGIMGPLAGILVDRVGPRKLMIFGWLMIGLGFFSMSRIDSLWAFYVTFLIIATGMSFGEYLVINTTIAHWFTRLRSRALTVVFVGFGTCGVIAPFLALSINKFGWRHSLAMIGIAMWLIGVPLSMFMRHKPRHYGLLPDGDTEEAIRETRDSDTSLSSTAPSMEFTAKEAVWTRSFWLLAVAYLFQHIIFGSVFVHVVPYLESVSFPSTTAATVVTGITLLSLIGRIGFGVLGDFFPKRYLIAAAIVMQVVGVYIFSFIEFERSWLVILFLLVFAPGYGGPMPLRPGLQADYFGTRSYGTIMGLMSVVSMPAGLVSPVFAGWVFDVTGSYRLAWQIISLMTLPAVILMLLATPPKQKKAR
jgi:MFS family permease